MDESDSLKTDYAFAWADEVVLIHEGSVLKSGTPLDVFSDTEALARTNLRPPSVLPLFQTLCRKHILSKELPVPRTLTELEQRLEALPDDAKKHPVNKQSPKSNHIFIHIK